MKLTIKKQTEETINVFPPLFYKKDKKYVGLISDEQVITFQTGKLSQYSNGETWLFKSDLQQAMETWEEIKEDEFIEAHELFLSSQSLRPVLVNNIDPDDLKGVL